VIITYLVGIGEFTHVIAGSIDVFTYAAMGRASWIDAFLYYTVPAFIGNVIGGLALVTALNHGQVTAGKENVG
jgi:formate/nitrite transporter FocA (FNT family)